MGRRHLEVEIEWKDTSRDANDLLAPIRGSFLSLSVLQ